MRKGVNSNQGQDLLTIARTIQIDEINSTKIGEYYYKMVGSRRNHTLIGSKQNICWIMLENWD
jgi:hypothetical protein